MSIDKKIEILNNLILAGVIYFPSVKIYYVRRSIHTGCITVIVDKKVVGTVEYIENLLPIFNLKNKCFYNEFETEIKKNENYIPYWAYDEYKIKKGKPKVKK